MNHDDLKLKIDECINWYEDQEKFDEVISYIKAIKLVVELHKPSGENWNFCWQCMGNDGASEIKNLSYPCSTIQAIEKELQ